MKQNRVRPERKHQGIPYHRLAQAAQSGTFYRRTPDEWAKLLGVSRQRFHQIRVLLRLPTHRATILIARTARMDWPARAQAFWQLGVYDRRGACWSSHERFTTLFTGREWRQQRILYRLRYGRIEPGCGLGRPSCGHRWCINPEHQSLVSHNVRQHRRALPRAERVAVALEAGLTNVQIARQEGVSPAFVSQINTGASVRGVRNRYPIRKPRKRRRRLT